MALKRQSITDAVKQDIAGRDLGATATAATGSMDTFSIRLTRRDRETLERYFDRRGLKVTQGIRMIITEYMVNNGLK
jgi:transposase